MQFTKQESNVIALENYQDFAEVKQLKEYAKVYYNRQRGYCVKLQWQGKRHYFSKYRGISVTKYKDLAQDLAKSINSDIDYGVFNPNQYKQNKPLKLCQYYKEWIKHIEPSLSSATLHDYENSFKNHILPEIGDKYLEHINRHDLKTLMNTTQRAPKGKYNVINALKKLLNDSLDEGLIKQAPSFKKLFTGKNQIIDPEIQWIEQNQQLTILEAIPIEDRPIFTFLTLTGCRPSEARALRKSDIKKDCIIFSKTFGRKGELKETKSKKVMSFPLTDRLRELFNTMHKPDKICEGEFFAFINPRTGKHYDKSFNRIWNKACNSVNINISLNHATRHSFATQMLNSNIPEGMVSKLLRHSNPQMIKRYGKYKTDSLKQAVDSVQSMQTNNLQTIEKSI